MTAPKEVDSRSHRRSWSWNGLWLRLLVSDHTPRQSTLEDILSTDTRSAIIGMDSTFLPVSAIYHCGSALVGYTNAGVL